MKIARHIFSISKDLQNIIQSDIENQVYHIQRLLVNELDNCKEKEKNIQKDISKKYKTYISKRIQKYKNLAKGNNESKTKKSFSTNLMKLIYQSCQAQFVLEGKSSWSWLGHAQSVETPAMSLVMQTCQNDLGLNLCVVPPTSWMVTISENGLIRSCKERDKARHH